MNTKYQINDFTQAVRSGDVQSATNFIESSSSLLTEHGLTMTNFAQYAARNGHLPMLKLLVENGANINHPSSMLIPEGIVDRTATYGHFDATRWLLDQGAQINFTVDGMRRCMPLVGAIRGGHFNIVKLLVERGAEINALWVDHTPLDHAIECDRTEMVEYLRASGAKTAVEIDPSLALPDDPILAHLTQTVGRPEKLSLREIVPTSTPITIHVVRASDVVHLFTEGMAQATLAVYGDEEPSGLPLPELWMSLPADWPSGPAALEDPQFAWPFHVLRKAARFPVEDRCLLSSVLALIPNGMPPQPFAPGVEFTHLVCFNGRYPASSVTLDDGTTIDFMTAIPIYPEELAFINQHDEGTFLNLALEQGIGRVVDPRRPRVKFPN